MGNTEGGGLGVPSQRIIRKRLNCKCIKHFPSPGPANGSMVWCQFHQGMRQVMFTNEGQWRLRCRQCQYSRKFGSNDMLCRVRAGNHARKYPHHLVDVFQPDDEIYKTYGKEEQGQLRLPEEEVPF